jgi:8-amino-7-oxononanoate synthase
MTTTSNAALGGRFGATRRDALIDGLRAAGRTRRAAPDAAPERAPAAAFDFTALPAHRAMRVQREAAKALSIDMPFFRTQAGHAGPECEVGGRRMLNFCSYDYLGFNAREEVRDAAKAAIDRYGVSVSASRVVSGERDLHAALESRIAGFLGAEASVVFVSGHGTNMSAIGTLMGPKDLVLMDALIHNSVAEGARLSGATRMSFPHNDRAWVDDLLSRRRGDFERVLIVVEGLYSMDGDLPDLRGFVDVKRRHDAWMMVDEAHSLGVVGATGRGIGEATGVAASEVEIWMGTLSPLTAAADKALELLEAEPERVARLQSNGARLLAAVKGAGLDTGLGAGFAVMPVIVGDSIGAAMLSDECFRRGLYALPITFPAVPEREARLRFFLSSEHSHAQIDAAAQLCAEAAEATRARRAAGA